MLRLRLEMRTHATGLIRVLPVFDAIFMASVLAVCFGTTISQPLQNGLPLFVLFLVTPFSTSLLRYFGVYESHRVEGAQQLIRRFVSAQVLGFFGAAAALVIVANASLVAPLLLFSLITTAGIASERLAVYWGLRALRRRGVDARNVCVIGGWAMAEKVSAQFARAPEWGLNVSCVGVGQGLDRRFFAYPAGEPIEGTLADVLREQVIDEVLIASAVEQLPEERPTIHVCEEFGVLGRVLIEAPETGIEATRLEQFGGDLCVAFGPTPRSALAFSIKRSVDLLLSSILLVVLSPLLLLIAILVRLSSEGPVIFRQTRSGLNGRRFTIYKFRTMVNGAESLVREAHRSITRGPTFKDPKDYRITDIGRLLRRTSFDELPQLVNVLKGDMSLVGPRPLPPEEAQAVSGLHRRRFSVLPGLTCFWQVSGRSNTTFDMWMRYDLLYVDTWSFWVDAKLLIKTIPAVISGRGAC